ncbi:MAG: substrate-binding domain-containing protein, partial [Eubacteriales bacterium]|nr:substrate-binding domain-containing protein [Eubacteriales bacterium]
MKKTPVFLSILLTLALSLGLFLVPTAPVAAESLEGPINIYTRDSASGTREGFEGVIGFKGELADTANEVSSNGDMAAKVGQDLNGIGYVSLSTDFEANNLHPVSYEGVEPTVENTISGDYALARPFAYATRAADDFESEEKAQLVEAFVAFMTQSTEGLETVLAAGGIVDVNAGTPWDELKANYPIVDQDNSGLEIVTVGSTSVEKVVQASLEAFQPLAGNFQFRMNQTGSGDGWKRVLGEEKDGPNAGDLGFASRYFKEDSEATDLAAQTGLVCQDAIVVVTHMDNAVENFSQDQLYDIFTGAVANWEEVKTAETTAASSLEGPINIYTRDSASGTREGFEG